MINKIIEKLKKKNRDLLDIEYDKLKNKNNFTGGSIGILVHLIVILKIFLLTIGTVIINNWYLAILIALYAVKIELELIGPLNSTNIVTNIINILFAFCCPCCWGTYKYLGGGGMTAGLYPYIKECEGANIFADFEEITDSNCEPGKICYKTNNKCHKVLYPDGTVTNLMQGLQRNLMESFQQNYDTKNKN